MGAGAAPFTRSTDGQIVPAGTSGVITGVTLKAGSDTATAILYNNDAASGEVLADLSAALNTTSVMAGMKIAFSNGVYLDIEGTGPSVVVYVE